MTITTYQVEKCNALGRAVPKLTKRLKGPTGPRGDSPAWDELWFVTETAAQEWKRLLREIDEACEPWFDNSTFSTRP